MPANPDRNLRLASASSPDTVEALFVREYDAMIRLAYVLVRSQSDAEEIVQDAFLDVQRRWPSLLNPGGYLRSSVVNGARRMQRRGANRRRILDSVRHPSASTSGEPEYLLDVLAGLPERYRTAIVLAYYLDLSPNEIAEALGCRPGTAKSLVHRGLKRLRRDLDNV
mgnify:CR=1 FL=1